MKQVYFAKSNRANPEKMASVRQTLKGLDCIIKEFEGGQYSNKDLIESDILVMLPETMLDSTTASVGKGLASQLEDFRMTNGVDHIFIVHSVSPGNLMVSKFVRLEITDQRSWTNTGKVHFREEPNNIEKFLDRKISQVL